MSTNNGTLFNGVLRPKLLNNPFASCSVVNLDFFYHVQHILTTTMFYHFLFSSTFSVSFAL